MLGLDKCLYELPNVIEAQQFSKELLAEIFYLADVMEMVADHGGSDILNRKRMIVLFYEPSTRTRLSFEMAMSYLGGHIFQTENAKEFSSAAKGETLHDTIKTLCGYRPDVIVLRHHETGSAAQAVYASTVPIINAGDGKGQHPTQALLDIYTIQKKFGAIDGLSVAMVGDLANGRTVRSLSYLLGKYQPEKIYFVSPKCARMGEDIKEYLKRHCVDFGETLDLRNIAGNVDVIYQTRTQKERGTSFDRNDHSLGYFTVDRTILDLMKDDAIIMHPLPKVDEIAPEVDQDPRAVYFEQAANGLFIRMALLKMILAPDA